MSNMSQEKFNFFVPFSIEKGGETGEMKISGICSSIAEDSDGEVLDPTGFDFKPLLKNGFFNWNHQSGKNPSAILGRPTKAEVRNGGKDFYVEGFLYKGSKEAQAVYQLAKTLAEEDPDRQLGFSIEGNAVERDSINKKRIKKAKITGVAITHCPKNPNTLLNIIKGDYTESFVEDKEELVTFLTKSQIYDQIFQRYTGDVEQSQQIFSLVKSVNKKLYGMLENQITPEAIAKAFELLDSSLVKGVNSSTSSSAPESSPQRVPEEIDDNNLEESAGVAEGDSDEVRKAKLVLYKAKIEAILEKEDHEDGWQHGDSDKHYGASYDSKESLDVAHKQVSDHYGSTHDVKKEIGEDASGDPYHQLTVQPKSTKKSQETGLEKAEGEGEEGNESVHKTTTDITSLVTEVKTSQEELMKSLTTELGDRFGVISELLKAQVESNQILKGELDTMRQRLEKYEREPNIRKSVTTVAHNRFAETDGNTIDANTYNISIAEERRHLGTRLMDEFVKSQTIGRPDSVLEKAIMDLEISKSLPTSAIAKLAGLGIKVVA